MAAAKRVAVGAPDRVGAVRDYDRVDAAPLEAFCRTHIDDFCGPMQIAQFHGRASNPTYLLTAPETGRRFVLRKQPPGFLQSSASNSHYGRSADWRLLFWRHRIGCRFQGGSGGGFANARVRSRSLQDSKMR